MFGKNDELVLRDYDYEDKKLLLQDYERRGNIGVLMYGEDEADEDTYFKRIEVYRKPVLRSRAEIMAEQKRMLRLGVYDDECVEENNNNKLFAVN